MRNMRWRLRRLESLPQLQPPPSPLEQIESLALRHLSDDDLEVMIIMTRNLQSGVRNTISERESAVVAAQNAALEAEARLAGFRCWAEAKRKGGRRR
jgi:hypothetical protein